MVLSLGTTQVINQLADLLYSFLPGKPHPYADPRISFRGIAYDLGIGRFWQDGSKLSAVTDLLVRTFDTNKGQFATLILEVVRRGLTYRESKDPVHRNEIDDLNDLLLKLGLRIKDLNDPTFLASLPGSPRARNAKGPAPNAGVPSPDRESSAPDQLRTLQAKLKELTELAPIRRGFAFEGFLNELFAGFGLAPRSSFRLVGEQIDGSFHHSGQTYLVEAKWQSPKTGQSDLLAFSGKVAGKAQWSRGAYISLTGYSTDGLEAFARGKQTNIICLDGLDLHYVLDGSIGLSRLIAMKARRAAESNEAFASVRSLVSGLS
jgi:hypothetical protein